MKVFLHFCNYPDAKSGRGNLGSFEATIVSGAYGDTHIRCIDDSIIGMKYWVKLIDGKYCLHREDGPAASMEGSIVSQYFYYKGYGCLIEDLPIDDETKVYLKLKYSGYFHGRE